MRMRSIGRWDDHEETPSVRLVTYKKIPDFFSFFYWLCFYLYIYYFYPPDDIQFGKKLLNHPIKPHFRPLLARFVAVFRCPHFLVFRSSRVPPSFFLTRPDQSVPCSDYSTLQIGYTNFFQTAFSSPFCIPTPPRIFT